MPKFSESLASRSQAAATIDPRLERALRRIVLVGLLAVHAAAGRARQQRLARLAAAVAAGDAAQRMVGPASLRPAALAATGGRAAPPADAAAGASPRPAVARRARATARCLNHAADAGCPTARSRPDLRAGGATGTRASVAGLARSRNRPMPKLSHALLAASLAAAAAGGNAAATEADQEEPMLPSVPARAAHGGLRPVPVAGRRPRRETARLGARAERQGRGRARQHRRVQAAGGRHPRDPRLRRQDPRRREDRRLLLQLLEGQAARARPVAAHDAGRVPQAEAAVGNGDRPRRAEQGRGREVGLARRRLPEACVHSAA